MSPDQLKLQEINEEDRHIQLALYEKLRTYLRAPWIIGYLAQKIVPANILAAY